MASQAASLGFCKLWRVVKSTVLSYDMYTDTASVFTRELALTGGFLSIGTAVNQTWGLSVHCSVSIRCRSKLQRPGIGPDDRGSGECPITAEGKKERKKESQKGRRERIRGDGWKEIEPILNAYWFAVSSDAPWRPNWTYCTVGQLLSAACMLM